MTKQPELTEEERKHQNGLMKEFCLANFTDEEKKPILLTDSQAELFGMIFQKRHPRNHVMTFTRYGKSFVCALAVLARVTTFAEKWCIVAGREKQARIIMSYMIDHIFDNDYMKGKFDIGGDSEDRIRRERSKQRLTFKHPDGTFGEVFVLSADSRNKQTAGDSVMGFGAQNVCVVGEYKISTDKGDVEISKIVNEKMDVKIKTYNHNSGKVEFKGIVEYQKTPVNTGINTGILEFEVGDRKFQCTNDHPIYIEGKGYIRADEVKEGDVVKCD